MSRNFRIAALVLAGALALTGCAPGASSNGGGSDEPVRGGTLSVTRSNPFEGFELDKQTLNASYQISAAVIEPLIRPSEDGMSLAPALASSWEFSDDNTVLTVQLDDAAAFSDGAPVTAEDVAFSVELWKQGPSYGAVYASIDRTEVVDEQTIELHLAYPNTTLPSLLSWAVAGVVPNEFGGRSAAEYWQSPVGAGAFVVDQWSANGEVVLTPNTHYYRDGLPYVDEVVSTYASDPNSVTLQLQSGQLDLADEITPVIASSLPDDVVVQAPEHITDVMIINTREGALADPKVRQAIGYALDYEALAETAFRGYAVAPVGPLPTNVENWAAPSEPYYAQDLERAEDLLDGIEVPTLRLTYATDPAIALAAQVIQDSLSKVGITVDLRAADSGTSVGMITSGDFDLGLFWYNAISPDASDPAAYVAVTEGMFSGLPTDALFGMLGEYDAAETAAEKETAITAMQDELSEQAPFIALVHRSALQGKVADVEGLNLTPWGSYDLATVWKQQ